MNNKGIIKVKTNRAVCPDLVILGSLCRCFRHATIIINHRSKAGTISKLTVYLQLMLFFTCRNFYFVNDKVRGTHPNNLKINF